MTDDAAQQTYRSRATPLEHFACDIHGWPVGEFDKTLFLARNCLKVFGRLAVCHDCLDRMSEPERKFFAEWCENYAQAKPPLVDVVKVAEPAGMLRLEVRKVSAESCMVHGWDAADLENHLTMPDGESLDVCPRCFSRLPSVMIHLTPREQP